MLGKKDGETQKEEEDRLELLGRISNLEKMLENPLLDAKECEVCHGLFKVYVVGGSEIRKRDEKMDMRTMLCWPSGLGRPQEEYIHKPIYCNRCAPKPKKKNG